MLESDPRRYRRHGQAQQCWFAVMFGEILDCDLARQQDQRQIGNRFAQKLDKTAALGQSTKAVAVDHTQVIGTVVVDNLFDSVEEISLNLDNGV